MPCLRLCCTFYMLGDLSFETSGLQASTIQSIYRPPCSRLGGCSISPLPTLTHCKVTLQGLRPSLHSLFAKRVCPHHGFEVSSRRPFQDHSAWLACPFHQAGEQEWTCPERCLQPFRWLLRFQYLESLCYRERRRNDQLHQRAPGAPRR